jgi:F-type H+-transporting ATPase subunit epsilon
MAELFTFEIHTPSRPFFAEPVEAVVLSLADGEMGIYAHHTPVTAPVSTGVFRIKDKKGQWRPGFVTNGILEVTESKAVLLVDAAEWPEEIDVAKAETSQKEAEEILANSSFKFEIDIARAALARAKMRFKVASMKTGAT